MLKKFTWQTGLNQTKALKIIDRGMRDWNNILIGWRGGKEKETEMDNRERRNQVWLEINFGTRIINLLMQLRKYEIKNRLLER